MVTPSSKSHTTLDEILVKRQHALNEVHEQKKLIKRKFHDMISPSRSTSKMENFINSFDKIMAIYDGAIIGMRLIHRIKGVMRNRRW